MEERSMSPDQYRKLRESMGLTQAALAEILGVHKITIAKREGGTLKISQEAEYALRWIETKEKKKG
jgi:DNA-binding transcriptional regulator YiaG